MSPGTDAEPVEPSGVDRVAELASEQLACGPSEHALGDGLTYVSAPSRSTVNRPSPMHSVTAWA